MRLHKETLERVLEEVRRREAMYAAGPPEDWSNEAGKDYYKTCKATAESMARWLEQRIAEIPHEVTPPAEAPDYEPGFTEYGDAPPDANPHSGCPYGSSAPTSSNLRSEWNERGDRQDSFERSSDVRILEDRLRDGP